MPVISKRKEVLDIYAEAERNRWVLPCFCTENLTTTEAVLAAVKDYGGCKGSADLPIIIAITNRYSHRTQSANYTHTRQWDIGLKLFLVDLQILTGPGSPFEKLKVMVHLDHIQFDDDQDLLTWDMNAFSSIMFDASKIPFADNIDLTRRFVAERGQDIVIEGACDEIMDAAGDEKSELTTARRAEQFCRETGVDLIVANLGTEHRADAKNLQYHGDRAREIKARIGTRIVLHGASSVPGEQIVHLIDDGVCKVNLWTALERDSSPLLFTDMVEHAAGVAGAEATERLVDRGLLGRTCSGSGKASIDYFTTAYRQNIIFREMKNIVESYLRLWYR